MAYGQSNLVLSIRGNSTVEGTDRLRGWGRTRNTAAPQLAASHVLKGMSGVTLSQDEGAGRTATETTGRQGQGEGTTGEPSGQGRGRRLYVQAGRVWG